MLKKIFVNIENDFKSVVGAYKERGIESLSDNTAIKLIKYAIVLMVLVYLVGYLTGIFVGNAMDLLGAS